jgi:hypothetical protein
VFREGTHGGYTFSHGGVSFETAVNQVGEGTLGHGHGSGHGIGNASLMSLKLGGPCDPSRVFLKCPGHGAFGGIGGR